MSSDVALRIEGLGKRYTIRHKDHDHVTLAQAALHRLRHPRGGSAREEFWALKDVSFEVPRGQVLGVIGHNGAGKSTLLKILSRITPPSTGRVEVFGRIGSLLEVGTGFHPELTGRENIYLNGSILGMKTKEIDRQFDAIVDFSGVEKFLDTPVKRYSSGMYVRLAFAVAAHLDTEILLLDEVLAVGDPDFQQRSMARVNEMARDGRTVLFVSHNRQLISDLTKSAVLLDKGQVRALGRTSDVVKETEFTTPSTATFRHLPAFRGPARLKEVECKSSSNGETDVDLEFAICVYLDSSVRFWRPNFTIRSAAGIAIGSAFGPVFAASEANGPSHKLTSRRLPLAPGSYTVDMSLSVALDTRREMELSDVVQDACRVQIPPLQSGQWMDEWGFVRISAEAGAD